MAHSVIWDSLPEDVRNHFGKVSSSIEVRRGEHLYRAGDTAKGLYLVESGLVGLVLMGASGKEHLMRFFREGQFFGHRALFSEEPYHGSAIALEPTRLRLLPKKDLIAFLDAHPRYYAEFVRALSRELRRCEEQHVMILENQMLARTAQALIYLKDLHPDHHWTRQEIANFVASTAPTIIKTLAELEDRGLIRQEGRAIQILDREGLLSLQDDTSG